MLQPGSFEIDRRSESIGRTGDLLGRLPAEIACEVLRPSQEKALKSPGGRNPFDVALVLKAPSLQALYSLADKAAEYQIRERLEALLDRFGNHLARAGLAAHNGRIIDASIVQVALQRSRRAQDSRSKDSQMPGDRHAPKRRQMDSDARWTKQHGTRSFGYQSHTELDAEHRLVRAFDTIPANVQHPQALDAVFAPDNPDPQVWTDRADRGVATEAALSGAGNERHVCEQGRRTQPLTDAQQADSRTRSKTRAGVERVFGFQHNSIGGSHGRTPNAGDVARNRPRSALAHALMVDPYRRSPGIHRAAIIPGPKRIAEAKNRERAEALSKVEKRRKKL